MASKHPTTPKLVGMHGPGPVPSLQPPATAPPPSSQPPQRRKGLYDEAFELASIAKEYDKQGRLEAAKTYLIRSVQSFMDALKLEKRGEGTKHCRFWSDVAVYCGVCSCCAQSVVFALLVRLVAH